MCYRLLPPPPPQVGSGQYGQVFEAYLQGASAKGVGAGRIVAVKTCKEGNPEQIKVGGRGFPAAIDSPSQPLCDRLLALLASPCC